MNDTTSQCSDYLRMAVLPGRFVRIKNQVAVFVLKREDKIIAMPNRQFIFAGTVHNGIADYLHLAIRRAGSDDNRSFFREFTINPTDNARGVQTAPELFPHFHQNAAGSNQTDDNQHHAGADGSYRWPFHHVNSIDIPPAMAWSPEQGRRG